MDSGVDEFKGKVIEEARRLGRAVEVKLSKKLED